MIGEIRMVKARDRQAEIMEMANAAKAKASGRTDAEKHADLQLAKKLRDAVAPDGTLAMSITAHEAIQIAQRLEETVDA